MSRYDPYPCVWCVGNPDRDRLGPQTRRTSFRPDDGACEANTDPDGLPES